MLLARLAEYDRLLDALAEMNAAHNISNGATGLLLLLEVFERHRADLQDGWYDQEQDSLKHKGWVPLSSILGTATVPADVALVIKRAVDKLMESGDIDASARWKALEFLAAEVLASA